jgi:adenosylmethionine-8-amino-7-oxononanoate aminotransferase
MQLYSPGLLSRLAAWAGQRQVFLIADEIAAGLGRLGAMLASHLVPGNPLPDFAVLSKGLTAGMLPLSAVLTTDAIHDLFDGDYFERKAFLHSNTYTGHALAVAVAGAVLDVFADEAILAGVERRSASLERLMSQLVAACGGRLTNLRTAGLMAAVDLRAPGGTPLDPRRRTGQDVYAQALQRGALLRPLADTMYLFPPLNIDESDLESLVSILGDSVDAVLR